MDPADLPLRDIQLPAEPGWWLPAPGWWVLLALILLAIAATWWLVRRFRSTRLKMHALSELDSLYKNLSAAPGDFVKAVSTLMRRVVISYFPRADTAGLTGDAWLNFLDLQLKDKRFSRGPGAALVSEAYRRSPSVDSERLFTLCRDWLQSLPQKTPPR